MVKKKSEEDDTVIPEPPVEEEHLDERQEDFLDDEQYGKYLESERQRIENEYEAFRSKKIEKDFIKDLPAKINSLEKAIEELQTAVKILWSQKKK